MQGPPDGRAFSISFPFSSLTPRGRFSSHRRRTPLSSCEGRQTLRTPDADFAVWLGRRRHPDPHEGGLPPLRRPRNGRHPPIRRSPGRVSERRRRSATNNRGGLVNQNIVLKRRHHEQAEVNAAGEVAFKDGVAERDGSIPVAPDFRLLRDHCRVRQSTVLCCRTRAGRLRPDHRDRRHGETCHPSGHRHH